jgi:hypothetical protein
MVSGSERSPTLAEHLGHIQIGSIVQKKLFGGYEVSLMQFLPVGLWLFLKGAVFGRARPDKLEVMAKMFVGLEAVRILLAPFGVPGAANNEQWVFECLRKVASDGMKYYRDHRRKEPEELLDLWLTSFAPPEADFRDLDKAKRLAKQKIRLGLALQQCDSWLFVGVSLGATFPELTERMWRQSFETADRESWARAREAGLDIPEEPTPLPLEEMEQKVLVEVATYVTEYFPELVDLLSLRLH